MADRRNISATVAREIKDIERKKSKAMKKGDYNEASKLCNSAGELLSTHGFFAEAIDWHEEEIKFSEIASDTLGLAIGNRKIGECFCELGKFEEAIKHQKQHLQLSQSVDNNVEEQRALATLGRTLFVMSDNTETEYERERCLKDSLDYYLKSFAISNKLREQVSSREIHEMRARLCLNIGLVYEWKNQLDQAEKYMEKALISSRENGLKDNMYRCYLSLSGVTAKNKKFQESLRLAKRAQYLAKEKADKSMEADAVLQLGQIFMKLGSFSTAVKLIRQSYKLHAPTAECDKESLFDNLKLAIKGERYSQQLSLDLDDAERFNLVEKLADVFSEVKSSEKALIYYQQQLELCERLEKGSRAIASIYISLAITHAENGDVDKALKFYRRELNLRKEAGFDNDFKEMTATYSAIAKLLEDSRSDEKSVLEAYATAVEFAEKSGSVSCLLNVYKEMIQTLQNYSKLDEAAAIEKEIEALEQAHEEIEGDSQIMKEEDGDKEIEEDIEELLHDSDSSEEEVKATKNARLARKKANKVNEKGETPLHVACIKGDVNTAKDLLERGASVHNRDFCGWQPLHEACNFGHTEIVKLLLLYGAEVNDVGGDHCGNVTPLHDASQNGHIDTVTLLISRGANPLAKDAKGRTPLSLVQAAIEADEEELEGSESDVLESRKKVRAFLRQVVLKSRPEPQLRNRNVLDQFTDQDARSSEDECGHGSIRKVKDMRNSGSDEESIESKIVNRRGKRNVANIKIEDDSESFCNVRSDGMDSCIEKTREGIGTIDQSCSIDKGSTYESMGEDMDYVHPPPRPLEPVESTNNRLPQSTFESFKIISSTVVPESRDSSSTSSDSSLSDTADNTGQVQTVDDYNAAITLSTSDSDSSDVELVDGFIVDDIGQNQARKKRRLEGFSGKRSVQQKISIPGQSSSNPRTKRKSSKRRSKSKSKSVKLKRKRQSKLKGFTAGTDVSHRQFAGSNDNRFAAQPNREAIHDNHQFTVNNGDCMGSAMEAETGFDNQEYGQSVSQAMMQTGIEHGVDMQNSQISMPSTRRVKIRVRVRIEKKLFLIPCVDEWERKTIEWLAQQASLRYSPSTGLTPQLSLTTKEGAILSNQDFVTDVLVNNEEIQAQIVGWSSGSISEKYETECALLDIAARPDIIDILAVENKLCNLNLADLNLKHSHLIAMTRSVVGHSKLSKIDLTGNLLGDDGVECVCKSIRYIPNLVSLNLSCTGMTSRGLSHLSKSLSLGTKGRMRTVPGHDLGSTIEELNCSYNSFEEVPWVAKSLTTIVKRCSALSSLALDHCFLPIDLFSCEPEFSSALKENKTIIALSLNGNQFRKMQDVFCAIPEVLQTLALSSSFTDFGRFLDNSANDVNFSHLKSLCVQSISRFNPFNRILKNDSLYNCLEALDISNSDGDAKGLAETLSIVSRLKSLREVNLSSIKAIDESIACQFIQDLVSSSSTLSVLKMTSCSINTLSNAFIKGCGNCKSLSHVDLSFNKLSLSDKQRLTGIWRDRYKHTVSFTDDSFCIVSVENHNSFLIDLF